MLSVEKQYELLPDGVIGTEADLDDLLRRLFRLRPGDNASLDAIRLSVTHYRLVVRREDGVIVKAAALPRVQSENERIAAQAAEERHRFAIDHPVVENRAHKEFEAAVEEIVGRRVSTLEAEVRELREVLDTVFTTLV